LSEGRKPNLCRLKLSQLTFGRAPYATRDRTGTVPLSAEILSLRMNYQAQTACVPPFRNVRDSATFETLSALARELTRF